MTELIIGGILLILAIIIYRIKKNKVKDSKINEFNVQADDTVLPIPQKPPKGNP